MTVDGGDAPEDEPPQDDPPEDDPADDEPPPSTEPLWFRIAFPVLSLVALLGVLLLMALSGLPLGP